MQQLLNADIPTHIGFAMSALIAYSGSQAMYATDLMAAKHSKTLANLQAVYTQNC
jgi:hypothetical protein